MEKGWRVILAFLGIFAAGAVTGGLLTLRAVQSRPAAPVEPPAPTVVTQNPPPAQVAQVPHPTPAPTPTPAPARTPTPTPTPPSAPVPAPEQLGPQLFRRLTNQLALTPAQREKVRPIELRATEELNRLRRDSQHSTELLIDKNEDEIRALLTPEQVAKFDDLVARQRDLIQKFFAEQQRKQREQKEKLFPNLNRGGNATAAPAHAPAPAPAPTSTAAHPSAPAPATTPAPTSTSAPAPASGDEKK